MRICAVRSRPGRVAPSMSSYEQAVEWYLSDPSRPTTTSNVTANKHNIPECKVSGAYPRDHAKPPSLPAPSCLPKAKCVLCAPS